MTDAMSKPENETASMCLDRIVVLERELAESRAEGLEQARLLGISGSREARLLAEIERLKRGEFVCRKCGLRKDAEFAKGDF